LLSLGMLHMTSSIVNGGIHVGVLVISLYGGAGWVEYWYFAQFFIPGEFC
jgi:hypothetical protein